MPEVLGLRFNTAEFTYLVVRGPVPRKLPNLHTS